MATAGTTTGPRTALRGLMPVRDVSLNVDIVGRGYPLVLMHGGPSADLWTLSAFRRLAHRFTLVFTTTAATDGPREPRSPR